MSTLEDPISSIDVRHPFRFAEVGRDVEPPVAFLPLQIFLVMGVEEELWKEPLTIVRDPLKQEVIFLSLCLNRTGIFQFGPIVISRRLESSHSLGETLPSMNAGRPLNIEITWVWSTFLI